MNSPVSKIKRYYDSRYFVIYKTFEELNHNNISVIKLYIYICSMQEIHCDNKIHIIQLFSILYIIIYQKM